MHLIKKLTPQKLKNIYHLAQAMLANFWYGFPSRKIKVIGVTGTNGKTTTCQMVAKILEEAGSRVAMISTINFKRGEKKWVNDTKYTTLSSFKVQKFIKQAIQAGCEYIIIETSSHSLDQNRVWGIDYDTAVITNITREHLDYHKTMEKYRQAKLKLFRKARVAVVNLDMEKLEEFIRARNEIVYGYSTQFPISNFQFPIKSQFSKSKFQKIVAENIELGVNHSSYKIQDTNFQLNLLGLFNVENALAATCIGLAYNINLQTTAKALEKINGIPGRMEYVPNDKELNIIIDYAVTPDSLEKLYSLTNKIKCHPDPARAEEGSRDSSATLQNDRKVIAVFGACGERDRGKRPIMGKIVSKYADYIVLTDEDPHNEDPWQIINEVEAGILQCHPDPAKAGEGSRANITDGDNSGFLADARNDNFCFTENINYWKILDRREAIKKALALAGPGDFVVVTGKGAEETMAIGDKKIPWNDKKIIQEALQEL